MDWDLLRSYDLCQVLILCSFITLSGSSCRYEFSSETSSTGTFTTPGYPRAYPNNAKCYYIFSGTEDDRIQITFLDFHLENMTNGGCPYDFIDYYTVDEHEVKTLERRMCGITPPPPMLTVHQRVELVFISDYIDPHKGFYGQYEFIDESLQVWAKNSPACGEFSIQGVGGVISSPGYPKPYLPHAECTWVIRVDKDKKIAFNFLKLDLGTDVTCTDTFVHMYNGFAVPGQTPDAQACGQLYLQKPTGKKEFTSNSYRATLRFEGGRHGGSESSGFQVVWTAMKPPEEDIDPRGHVVKESCPEVKCSGSEYCSDSTYFLCHRDPPSCIASSLRCNGVPNCGSYDSSDEDGCMTKIILLIVAVVAPLVTIIVASIVICRYCKFRRQRRMKQAQNPDITSCILHNKRKHRKDKSAKDVKLEQLDSSPVSKRHSIVYSHSGQPSITYSPSYCSRYKGLESAVPGHYENPYDVKTHSPPHPINSGMNKTYGTQSSPLYAAVPRVSPAHLRRSTSLREQRPTQTSISVTV